MSDPLLELSEKKNRELKIKTSLSLTTRLWVPFTLICQKLDLNSSEAVDKIIERYLQDYGVRDEFSGKGD